MAAGCGADGPSPFKGCACESCEGTHGTGKVIECTTGQWEGLRLPRRPLLRCTCWTIDDRTQIAAATLLIESQLPKKTANNVWTVSTLARVRLLGILLLWLLNFLCVSILCHSNKCSCSRV